MLTRDQKARLVEGLEDRFRRERISIFTDIRGISVAKLTALRRELKKAGAELKVVKKPLLARALEAAGLASSGIEPKALAGEIAVVFGYADQVNPAKVAAKFAKENETFRVLKGILERRLLETAEVLALARLPSREQLMGGLAAVLAAPLQNLVNVLQGNVQNLVVILNQIKGKKT